MNETPTTPQNTQAPQAAKPTLIARAEYLSDGTVVFETKDPKYIALFAKLMKKPGCEWESVTPSAEGCVAFKAPAGRLQPKAKKRVDHGKGFQKGHGAMGGRKKKTVPDEPKPNPKNPYGLPDDFEF